jgi:hypothetical protein
VHTRPDPTTLLSESPSLTRFGLFTNMDSQPLRRDFEVVGRFGQSLTFPGFVSPILDQGRSIVAKACWAFCGYTNK